VTLQSKINGDPSYVETPLLVDFELPVGGGKYSLTFTQSLASYLTVAIALMAANMFYENKKEITLKNVYLFLVSSFYFLWVGWLYQWI
jgi:hypothetical protein